MQDQVNADLKPKRVPWNKGKLTGAKPPLRPKHVWSIRTKLQIEGRVRDLAMFNLAIDSKLRGCDVVAIRVEDVAAGGYTADRATVRQKRLLAACPLCVAGRHSDAATIKPAPCAHGSRSLRLMHMGPVFCVRSLVGSPVAPVSVDASDCDIAPFAHPFVEGAASGRLQRSCIDDSDRLLCASSGRSHSDVMDVCFSSRCGHRSRPKPGQFCARRGH
jgi:hypothetical protein